MAARIWQALTWDDLAWIRDAFDGPFLLKGLQSTTDAVRARELGVDGIIVSNHGGRQLDAAPAPVSVLPAIRAAVGPEMVLILDSGIRRGSHIGRALAMGADFAIVGRATLYGAAAAGQPGVARALDILRDELDRFQAQTGLPGRQRYRQSGRRPGGCCVSAAGSLDALQLSSGVTRYPIQTTTRFDVRRRVRDKLLRYLIFFFPHRPPAPCIAATDRLKSSPT